MTKKKAPPAPPDRRARQVALRDELLADRSSLNEQIAVLSERLEKLLADRIQTEHELACAEAALAPVLEPGTRLLPPDEPAVIAWPRGAVADDSVYEQLAEQEFGPLPPPQRDPVFDD